ncbi:phosphatase PAP2 family protein [Mucilaginibacter sp.]|uniref:phosphatase PAP2 family protein n=1 Tax=Mucilaginibacter sp. TaxID=1882438 RepID=UPI003D0A3295
MNISIKDILQRIRPFFILYLLLLCACFIIKILYTKEQIYFAVNERNCEFADWIAPYITDIGNGWTTIALSALLLLFNYRAAFLLATAYAVTSLFAQVLKFIFDKPRPTLLFKDQLSRIHLVPGVDMLKYNSFPSGHTVSAFSAAIVILYITKNKNWSVPLLILAVLIGYSRMYLSQHFFEDVMAGSVVGVFIAIFWLSYIGQKKFLNSPQWSNGLIRKSK